jgi:hypothetical protein
MKPKFNLEDLKRENVHNVPENYFDKLPNRIMQRVIVSSPETSEAKSWLPAPLRLALAGSGFAAVFATVFMLNQAPEFPQVDFLASVPQTEIVNYLLASEQLDQADLTSLNIADQNLTAEFINANDTEIQRELEDEPIENLY